MAVNTKSSSKGKDDVLENQGFLRSGTPQSGNEEDKMDLRKRKTLGHVAFTLLAVAAFVMGVGSQSADAKTRVVVAQGVEPTRLDPDMHRENTSNNVILNIYDALVERDAQEKIVPDLAETWRFLDDNTLEFKLRKGIKFSNGEPFNAEVVKYNVERVAGLIPTAKKTLNPPGWENVKEAKVVDEYTVQIITKAPYPLLLSLAAQKYMVPVEYTKKDNFESLATKPIGTGPYVLKSWMKGGELILEAKKDYWKGAPKIDEIVFRPIPDDSTRLAELKVGNVDIISNLKPDNVKEIEAEKTLQVKYAPSARTAMVFINGELPNLKDVRVRKAVNHALDVPSLIKNVMGGNAFRVSTVCPKNFVGWDPEEKFYDYNPEKAKQLLAEAGFPNGFEATILTPRGRYLNDVQACEAIAGMLTAVGIRTKVNAVEFGVFAKQTQAHQIPEFMYAAWGNPHFNVLYTISAIARSGQMFSWHSNKELDDLIDAAAKTVEPQKHEELLRKALRVMYEDPGFAFLYNQRDIYGVNKRVSFEPRPDEDINLHGASVK
jgi:peptide/nickel transport system substrate-binding protein